MHKKELMDLLKAAADYFSIRGFVDWEKEARDSITKIENDDFSIIESLWLKYAPTGDIDNLFITKYELEDEERVNALNDQLAEIVNSLFAVLDETMNVLR